jgi:hypothetical protein
MSSSPTFFLLDDFALDDSILIDDWSDLAEDDLLNGELSDGVTPVLSGPINSSGDTTDIAGIKGSPYATKCIDKRDIPDSATSVIDQSKRNKNDRISELGNSGNSQGVFFSLLKTKKSSS